MSDTLRAQTASDFDFLLESWDVAETNRVMDFTPAEGGPE